MQDWYIKNKLIGDQNVNRSGQNDPVLAENSEYEPPSPVKNKLQDTMKSQKLSQNNTLNHQDENKLSFAYKLPNKRYDMQSYDETAKPKITYSRDIPKS